MRDAKCPLRLVAGALLSVLLGSAPARAQFTVTPPEFSVTVTQGETATRTVTLINVGSEALALCLSFDRPLQRLEGTTQLTEVGEGSVCGDYGEVLYLIDQDGLPGCCADPYGLTMTPEGRIFAAEYDGGRTYELDAALSYVRMFEHPEVAELEPFPVTTGVAYDATNGTLWWLNIESQGFPVRRALLLEGDLDGVPTGRRIELPVAEDAPPPYVTGSPVGLSYDAATKRYYYVDFANDDVWAVDTLGNLVDGYPITFEAYPGVALGFGLDAHSASEDDASEGNSADLRFEVGTNIPGQPGLRRIVTVDGLGGDTAPAPAAPLETPLLDPLAGTEDGGMSGEPVRSVLDPNGVLYYPWSGFQESGVVAVRPHPLPPSWLVVETWDGILEPGESREIALTFRPGQRAVGEYTAVLQAFEAETGAAVEVPLTLTVTQETGTEDETVGPTAAALSVYPNPLGGVSGAAEATVALTLDRANEARVVVYDVLGREVATLHAGELRAGTHVFDLDGRVLPAGIYLIRAEGGAHRFTKRLTVVR